MKKKSFLFKIIQKAKKQANTSLKEILDGSMLTKEFFIERLPFIFFLSILTIFYIGNRYHAEKLIRDISFLQKEVKDLRAESITTTSELMFISKESEVLKLSKKHHLGLEELKKPPKKIIINLHSLF